MNDEQPDSLMPTPEDAVNQPSLQKPQSAVTSKPEMIEGNNFNPQIRTQYSIEPKVVHASRDYDPKVPAVSERLQRKHERSARMYPFLNLSEGEFVILRVTRHPIGLFIPSFLTGLGIIFLTALIFLVPDFYASLRADVVGGEYFPTEVIIIGVLLLLVFIVALFGGVSIWVYLRNHFFLTNESVIQEIQHGLFSHHEQTVSLGSIEDASYRRQGIMQHIFDYGTMRLSTEGEETTYIFSYVENPKKQVAIINNAVEAFKNGRPVDDDED